MYRTKFEKFAICVHAKFSGRWLTYRCSPLFNWGNLVNLELKEFQDKLAAIGYEFQFAKLAGFPALMKVCLR
ncbi:hypothetical protein PHSC3_001979 [Chlamydiales bacterium STE3]|nr:hypothetical protein PHSC3_001979 [Chlamydiales bacterium STE3]